MARARQKQTVEMRATAPAAAGPVRNATAGKPADLASEARAGHLLRRAYHKAREQAAILLRDLDVTPRQSAALQVIAMNGPLSQAEIGASIGMEPANVHGLVDRLKKKGLIGAARDPSNPRRMRVEITEAGAAMIRQLEGIARQGEDQALEALTPQERETLVLLLRKMLGA